MDKVEKVFQKIQKELEQEAGWIEEKVETSEFLPEVEKRILLEKRDCLLTIGIAIGRALKELKTSEEERND